MNPPELIGRERFGELCPTCLYSFVVDELDNHGLTVTDHDMMDERILNLLTPKGDHHEREPSSNGNGMA